MIHKTTRRAALVAAAVAAAPGGAAAQDATSYDPAPGSAPTTGGKTGGTAGQLSDSMSYSGGSAVRAKQAERAERVKDYKVPKAGSARIVHEAEAARRVDMKDGPVKVWDPEEERYTTIEPTPEIAMNARSTPAGGRMPDGWCRFEVRGGARDIDGDGLNERPVVRETTFRVDVVRYTGFEHTMTGSNAKNTDSPWETFVKGDLETNENAIETTVEAAAACFTHVQTSRETLTTWQAETGTTVVEQTVNDAGFKFRQTVTKRWETTKADDDEVTKWDTIKFRSYGDSRDVQEDEEKGASGRFDEVENRDPEEERLEKYGTYVAPE